MVEGPMIGCLAEWPFDLGRILLGSSFDALIRTLKKSVTGACLISISARSRNTKFVLHKLLIARERERERGIEADCLIIRMVDRTICP